MMMDNAAFTHRSPNTAGEQHYCDDGAPNLYDERASPEAQLLFNDGILQLEAEREIAKIKQFLRQSFKDLKNHDEDAPLSG